MAQEGVSPTAEDIDALARVLLALGALAYLSGLRFALLRWHELKATERRMRRALAGTERAVTRFENASSRVEAAAGLQDPSSGDTRPSGVVLRAAVQGLDATGAQDPPPAKPEAEPPPAARGAASPRR